MLKHKTIQKRKPTAQADGCDLALKGSLACIDQTQPLIASPDGTSLKVDDPRNELSNRVLLLGFNHQTVMHCSPPANQVPHGKKQGCWIGRVATRMSGSFRVGPQDGISYRYLTHLQQADGYQYQPLTPAIASCPKGTGYPAL